MSRRGLFASGYGFRSAARRCSARRRQRCSSGSFFFPRRTTTAITAATTTGTKIDRPTMICVQASGEITAITRSRKHALARGADADQLDRHLQVA